MTNHNTSKNNHLNDSLSRNDLDSQISYFQEQLSKAQNTLLELENLKTKINQEKNEKMETKTLKEENEKLKAEIKNLKETITNIKNDFTSQAEEFKKNLLISLEKVEKVAEKNHPEKEKHHNQKTEDSNESIEKEKEPIPTKKIEDSLPFIDKIEEKIEIEKDANEDTPHKDNETRENNNHQTKIDHHSEITIPIIIKQSEIIEEEFTDFEKIKKELEELEKTDEEKDQLTTNPKITPKTENNSDNQPENQSNQQKTDTKEPKQKNFFLRIFKKIGKTKKEQEIKAENALKPDLSTGRLFIKTAMILMFLFTAGMSYQIFNAETLRNEHTNHVKGVYTQNAKHSIPDDIRKEDVEIKYPNAFLNVPFDQTIWTIHNDSEFGVKINYPKNTSHRHKPIGSNNIWFIRKHGYILSLERIQSNDTLEIYWEKNKSDVLYEIEKTTFKKFPALHLILKDNLSIKGNIYLIKANGFIYKIWYKTFYPGENPDDQQRVMAMLESLEFIKIR